METGQFRGRCSSAGILRDGPKSRRSSMECMSIIPQGDLLPLPHTGDHFSVTFADESVKSDPSHKCITGEHKMEKVHFPGDKEADNSDEEDYSARVSAIMQRRASTRKSRRRSCRRTSSPFSPDVILPTGQTVRRRSSGYTTSSGDTAITVDDSASAGMTQEEIFENIKLHKEVLSSVKMQPWNTRKKIRLVMQAKSYIKQHKGVLQERLAQNRTTRDMLTGWNLYLTQKWHRCRREAANISNWFIPWEQKIKAIESHFGSAVASYFIFLRWLFWVNVVIAFAIMAFVAIPEQLKVNGSVADERKMILPEDKYSSTNFLTLWDFKGIFEYSLLFYGWYTDSNSTTACSDSNNSKTGYLPFAYFLTGLSVYAYSFVAILRKMAKNSRMSKLSEKGDECIFSWKVFTGWDYMIGNAETAHIRIASIVMGFREALLEEAEKQKEPKRWKVIFSRILVNAAVVALLSFSAYAVVMVVDRSKDAESNKTAWRRNEITLVLSSISTLFPMLFELCGYFEGYHPRKQLRLQLARIMVLNLLNLYSLIVALIYKIDDYVDDQNELKQNLTELFYEQEVSTNIIVYQDSMEKAQPQLTPENQILLSDITNNTLLLLTGVVFTTTKSSQIGANEGITNTTLLWVNNATESEEDVFYNNFTDSSIDGFNTTYTVLTNSTGENFNVSFRTENVTFDGIDNHTSLEDFYNDNFDYNDERAVMGLFPNESTQVENKTIELITNVSWFTNESYTISFTTELSITEQDETTDLDVYDETTSDGYKTVDYDIINTTNALDTTMFSLITTENPVYKKRLRSLCWETMFGQELVKLTVMDLILTIIYVVLTDFLRAIFVRYMNNCWCWDLEKKFPQYGDFKVAENILHLVNNQGMVWMGMFFSPGLIVLNVIKLFIIMYLRSWAVLTCNVPHEVLFRASRSNNFYYALLLMMLFLCVLPVGYAIVWIKPSEYCGPFSTCERIYHIFTKTIKRNIPKSFFNTLEYIASPGIVIPLLLLLILIIYYFVSLTTALREANEDLKAQLFIERTEERRKVFQIAKTKKAGSMGSAEFANTPFAKWRKLLSELPSSKNEDDPKQFSHGVSSERGIYSNKGGKTEGKAVNSDEEVTTAQDDGTDTEQHESLPEDKVSIIEVKTAQPSVQNATNAVKNLLLKNANASSSSTPLSPETILKAKRGGNTSSKKKISCMEQSSSKSTGSVEQRRDSVAPSEGIPVITISKTESSESILQDAKSKRNVKNDNDAVASSYKPKIKYMLKKQDANVDIDSISFI